MSRRALAAAGAALIAAGLAIWLLARPSRRAAPTLGAVDVSQSRPVRSGDDALAASEDGGPRVVVRARWGGGLGEIGRSPVGTAPEGPTALAACPGGGWAVLDHVNKRVDRWDGAGAPFEAMSIGESEVHDISCGESGRIELATGEPEQDHLVFGDLRAEIVDRRHGVVEVSEKKRRERVELGSPLLSLVLFAKDARGHVWVGGLTGRESATPPDRLVDLALVVVSLEGRRLTLPVDASEPPIARPLALGDDGTIYRLRATSDGVRIEAY
jgi:hypothetical protein